MRAGMPCVLLPVVKGIAKGSGNQVAHYMTAAYEAFKNKKLGK
jgi:hypothetical protein